MNTEKTSTLSIVNNLIGALLGIFLASFSISIVMEGIWAFVLAIVGGIATSLLIRFARIMKIMLIGLIVGYSICLAVFVWVGLQWNLSTNKWVGVVFVLTLGIVRTFISDDLLVKWFSKISHKDR